MANTLQGRNHCLLWEAYWAHKYTTCTKYRLLLMIKSVCIQWAKEQNTS